MQQWQKRDIPNQHDKRFLVTGANSGLGLTTVQMLLEARASVVMAVRNLAKSTKVFEGLKSQYPGSDIQIMHLDLADLNSVSAFADAFLQRFSSLDVLVNNAGIMFPSERQTSAQGFELQLATNHFGHFVLTQKLFPLLQATPDSRIVTVSSIVTKMKDADIYFDDLQFERQYKKMASYAQSKLANILFALELHSRLVTSGSQVKSLLAHPGYTATNLQQNMGLLGSMMNAMLAQKPEMGALPTLRAATDPSAKSGDYFGPSRFGEYRGNPVRVSPPALGLDPSTRKKCWAMSESLTGVNFEV